MAQSKSGGPRPPQDFLLTDRTAREPEAGTGPDSFPEGVSAAAAERGAPAKGGEAPSAEVEPSVPSEAEPEKTAGGPRTGSAIKAEVQALEALSERLEGIETPVGSVPPPETEAADICEQLRLARSALVGVSSRMEALDRLVRETAGEIRGTGDTVREAAARVEKKGFGLDLAARTLERKLERLTRIEHDVRMLKLFAGAWSVGNAVVLVLVFLYVAERLGWIG